jgi:GDP-L-fucose synthase
MELVRVHVIDLSHEINVAKTLLVQVHTNLGSNSDVVITEVAEMIRDLVGFKGTIDYDTGKHLWCLPKMG